MFYDESYNYNFISKEAFDNKYLLAKKDGSKYKKYLIIYYKEADLIKCEEIPNREYSSKFNNILSIHEVEEIISSCQNFDGYYSYMRYYKIDNDLYFTKYKDLEGSPFIGDNNNEEIKKRLEELI